MTGKRFNQIFTVEHGGESMPALYAHVRFGRKVSKRMDGKLKKIIEKYYTQYQIGLQGPDIFFFYRAFCTNRMNRLGHSLHQESALPFFEHALEVVKEKGRDTKEYAYLCGFICHFILDSECHGYVEEMRDVTKAEHLEIEEEFEKKLLRMDHRDPYAFPLASLIPADEQTAKAIAPFYSNVKWREVRESLRWFCFIKRLFTAPTEKKHDFLNAAIKISGKSRSFKGLVHQRKDNENCIESNSGLLRRFDNSVDLAVRMIESFDRSLTQGEPLDKRFDRNFE